jgi:hypothetical protein
MTRITVTLREDKYTIIIIIIIIIIISSRIILRIRNVSDKFVTRIKTRILSSIMFFSENLPFYEIMCKNIVKPDGSHMKI